MRAMGMGNLVQSHRTEMMISVAVVTVAIMVAHCFYVTKKPKDTGCLDPENFKEFKLVKHTQLSHNVAKGKDSVGEDVVKAYTPTTLDSDVGYFELVIKMYPQGRMSHHFREMREGYYLAVKGPKILRCGPPLMNMAVAAHLDALGYTPQMQFQF